MKNFLNIIFFISLFSNPTVKAQSLSTKGQFWASGLTGNDAPSGQSTFESSMGYIPTFSLSRDLSDFSFFDFEWAYRLDRTYSGGSLLYNNESHHRYWVRYSSDKLEARLGLQKIVFGPSQILRSLSWFDTIDLRDPTGQTDGVEAFRLRGFPSNTLSMWSWAINNDQDTLSFGWRVELSTNQGEWGFTYHQDPSKSLQMAGQETIPDFGSHNRLAVDYRYDGFIGFWNESALISSDRSEIIMATVGADYTLPIATGILVMMESTHVSREANDSISSQTFTAFMASMPMGMFYNIMLISTLDWDENNSYNYLRFSSAFDSFSINCMVSINPSEVDNSIQLMFIYDH